MNAGADCTETTGAKALAGLARKVGGKIVMGAYDLPAATAVPADFDGDDKANVACYTWRKGIGAVLRGL